MRVMKQYCIEQLPIALLYFGDAWYHIFANNLDVRVEILHVHGLVLLWSMLSEIGSSSYLINHKNNF